MGSPDLAQAMAATPCGCELAVEADRVDAEAAEVYRADAPVFQKRWRCPHAGHAPAAELRQLDAGCRATHAGVVRLLGGGELLPTCPLAGAREPWVGRVCRARKWAERGQLDAYEPAPPAQLFDLIDALDDAIAARDRADAERRKHEAEAATERARAPRRPDPHD